jgi:hypothetical protein
VSEVAVIHRGPLLRPSSPFAIELIRQCLRFLVERHHRIPLSLDLIAPLGPREIHIVEARS